MIGKYFSKLKIVYQISLLGVVITLAFLLLLAFVLYPEIRASRYEAKRNETRNLALSAYSTLAYYAELADSGALTVEEAQQQAMQIVKIMRYTGNNYFWINDLEPKMVMHPNYTAADKPEWYQTNGLATYADPNGKRLFVEFVTVAKADGEGFVDYAWTKPGMEGEKPAPKISYVKLLPEWGWVVGTGMYVDDVETEIAQLVGNVLLVFLGIVGGVIILTILLARSISRPIQAVTHAAVRLSEGDVSQEINIQRGDEIGALAAACQDMITYQKEMTLAAHNIARGDLTTSISARSERDTFGNALVEMNQKIRGLIGQIAESAAIVSAESDALTQSVAQSNQTTEQIAQTIEQIARSSTEQTASISRTAASVEQMALAIEGVARGGKEQASAVEQAAQVTSTIGAAVGLVVEKAQSSKRNGDKAIETGRAGAGVVQQTIAGMQTIQERMTFSAKKVAEMGNRSEQIGNILATIEDIAAQTNLLALNAAIEAARAGEHGKGFAVVADEVRKLAVKSAAATKEIGALIAAIQQTVIEAVAAMEESEQEVNRGVAHASNSGEALAAILQSIEGLIVQAGEIAAAAQNMQASSGQMVQAIGSVASVIEKNANAAQVITAASGEANQMVENIASISEENSAAIQEVAASAVEMAAQAQGVRVTTQSLAEMARRLQAVVGQFKLSESAGQEVGIPAVGYQGRIQLQKV